MKVLHGKNRRPVSLRRSWLFVSGLNRVAQQQGLASGADVLVADLEEFTAPADRPAARLRICQLLQECRQQNVVGAVRINKLDEDGLDDLDSIMAGAPDAVLLPHSSSAAQINALAVTLTVYERRLGLTVGSTEIVPALESAVALVRTPEILMASSRVSACLLAAEDLSTDLGLERGPDGIELHHIRARFLVECLAASCLPIDCPFNYRDTAMLAQDLKWARRVGFKSKCAIFTDQIMEIHRAYTPSPEQVSQAHDRVLRYAKQRQGQATGQPPVDGPDVNTAKLVIARHEQFEHYDRRVAGNS